MQTVMQSSDDENAASSMAKEPDSGLISHDEGFPILVTSQFRRFLDLL